MTELSLILKIVLNFGVISGLQEKNLTNTLSGSKAVENSFRM